MSASPATDAEMEAEGDAGFEAGLEAQHGADTPTHSFTQPHFLPSPAPVPVSGETPMHADSLANRAPRPSGVHTKHLTELERFRVRTLYYDACITKKRIQEITGYSHSQIRTAVRAKSAQIGKRTGRPKKGTQRAYSFPFISTSLPEARRELIFFDG